MILKYLRFYYKFYIINLHIDKFFIIYQEETSCCFDLVGKELRFLSICEDRVDDSNIIDCLLGSKI